MLVCLTALPRIHGVDYTDLDLGTLLRVQITSASRRAETAFYSPSSVYVVSADDLARGGHILLADALAGVPGVQTARPDAANTNVSIRGFNDRFSDKLLVLEDGRSVYDRLFAGVFWNFSGSFLPDVEHIEVVRGPGASLWGTNAVNGVINVISRSAFDTTGHFLRTSTGSGVDHAFEARYGARLGERTAFRVYARSYFGADLGTTEGEGSAGWNTRTVGLRIDHRPAPDHEFTLIADLRDLRLHSRSRLPLAVAPYQELVDEFARRRGGMILARWQHQPGETLRFTAQASVERINATELNYNEHRTIVDADTQVDWRASSRHHVVVGLNARHEPGREAPTAWTVYTPERHIQRILGVFAQDEIALIPEKLALTLGSKFEHSDYVGWRLQPSSRLGWHPTERSFLWMSLGAADRLPSRVDRAGRAWVGTLPPSAATGGLPVRVDLSGSGDFDSERLTAAELGGRIHLHDRLEFDASVFLNRYRGLRTLVPAPPVFAPTPAPHLVAAAYARNASSTVSTYGGEAILRWHPHASWQVEASIAALQVHLPDAGEFDDYDRGVIADSAPEWQQRVRLRGPLPALGRFEALLSHRSGYGGGALPAYTGLTVHLSWPLPHYFEFGLTGRDLLDPSHPETVPSALTTTSTEIARSFVASLSWSY